MKLFFLFNHVWTTVYPSGQVSTLAKRYAEPRKYRELTQRKLDARPCLPDEVVHAPVERTGRRSGRRLDGLQVVMVVIVAGRLVRVMVQVNVVPALLRPTTEVVVVVIVVVMEVVELLLLLVLLQAVVVIAVPGAD